MQPVAIAAIVVAAAASAFDLRSRKIPNLLTFGAAVIAFITHFWIGGPLGFATSVLGWLCGLALFLPFFAVGGMGAGDVKLLAALGAWLGPALVLWTALFSAIAGGVQALFVCFRYGYTRTAFLNIRMLVSGWMMSGPKPIPELTLAGARGPRLAYAVPVTLGTIVALWMRGLS